MAGTASVGLGLAAFGCSGSDVGFNDGGGDATAVDTGSGNDAFMLPEASPLDDAGADANSDASDDATSPDLGCLTDDAGCVACCFNNHPDGAATYFGALTTCACSTGATCHSVSSCYGNFCKGNAPSTSCDKCLSNPDAGDCYNKADQACSSDQDCVSFFGCIEGVCAPPPPQDAAAD